MRKIEFLDFCGFSLWCDSDRLVASCDYLLMTTQSELPGLTPARVIALASTWDDGGLWADVRWLAQRCWNDDDAEPLAVRWHHLVLAVGNFKRQSGRRLRPGRISGLPNSKAMAKETFVLPSDVLTSELKVHRDDEESWRRLGCALPGAAIATTTTLLAALWPDDHFVFDWRVEAAANALRIRAELSTTRWPEAEREGRKRVISSFSDYSMVRRWLQTIEDCEMQDKERALYRLSQSVPTVKGRSWPDYAKEVVMKLESY